MSRLFSMMRHDAAAQSLSAHAVPGLRRAVVERIEAEGYILTWLSGPVRSESAPARAAAFMAGKERGAYFPYEVGDEVVAGFEDGNVDLPIILGGLWSSEDPPPPDADTSDSNNTRTIVSRAGAELTFDDTKGETGVLLRSAGGIEIRFDDKAKSLTIQAGPKTRIVLDAKGVTIVGAKINLN
jgi:uncharacterized protein involved in type VI secretion and phage assembly